MHVQPGADPLASTLFPSAHNLILAELCDLRKRRFEHNDVIVTHSKAAMASEPQAQTVPIASTSTPSADDAPQQPLSKNAQKKLARAARVAEQKKERRAHEKEKRKEKKRELAAKRAAGELGEEDEGPRKKARIEGPRTPFEARIVVDLGFDDKMSENVNKYGSSRAFGMANGRILQEVRSLTSQLAYTYNAHRKATTPFSSLLFTSLNGRTFTRLESMSDAAYKRWKDTEWWEGGYERLWESKLSEDSSEKADAVKESVGADEGITQPKLAKDPQTAAQGSVVYLTADSSEELSELQEGDTYIIGGIVDHNRYKVRSTQTSSMP